MSESKTKKYKTTLPPWMIDSILREDEKLAHEEENTLWLPLQPYLQNDEQKDNNPTFRYEIVDYVIRNYTVGNT